MAAAGAGVVGMVCTSSSEEVNTGIHVEELKPFPTSQVSRSPSPTVKPTAPPVLEAVAQGFRFPIAGACLPEDDELMPNAPREYRFGLHEGVDFYEGQSCVPVGRGMPVLAAKTGVVVHADHDYREITAEEMDALLARSEQENHTDAATLDRLRGRQVWLHHGDGIVSRYAHLLAIEAGVQEGVVVEAGQVVGYVGNTGTPEGVSDPDVENHLHFEIRVGDGYLGQGLGPAEVRRLWERTFAP